MRAVMNDVPPHILEWRRKTGADRWDEVWEGVLHMAPNPTREHQDIKGHLYSWLKGHWARADRRPYLGVNVSRPAITDWTKDYRVPDLVLLTDERAHVDRNEYFDGGPDVVVEIRSPQDETDERLPFYAAVGVREVWVIDRDSRACAVHAVEGGELRRRKADAHGWIASTLGVELRTEGRQLAIRLIGDEASCGRVP